MSEVTSQKNSTATHRWKRYPKYKDSGVEWLGEVPEGWDISQLGWKVDLIVPMRDKPPEFNGDIPWIRIEDFNGKFIGDSKTNQKVSHDTIQKLNLKIFPIGTVLCSCSCVMGSTAIVKKPLVSNQTFIGLVPKIEIDSNFLFYLMNSNSDRLQFMGSGAIQQYLSKESFSKLKLAIPTLKLQQIISAFIDRETTRIDNMIARKEQQIQLLQEKRVALISHSVTKGLDSKAKVKDSAIEWIPQIPDHWNEMRARDLYRQMFLPPKFDAGIVTVFRDGQVTLRTNRRTEGFTNAILEVGYQSVRNGDLVIHSMDAFAGAIGVSDSNGKCTGEYVVCEPLRDDVNNDYYGILLRVMALGKYILAICPSVRERAPRFRFNTFKDVLLPVPPINEQRDIVSFIDKETKRIDNRVEKVSHSIDLLKEYRFALISAAVTGKIDVRDEVKA